VSRDRSRPLFPPHALLFIRDVRRPRSGGTTAISHHHAHRPDALPPSHPRCHSSPAAIWRVRNLLFVRAWLQPCRNSEQENPASAAEAVTLLFRVPNGKALNRRARLQPRLAKRRRMVRRSSPNPILGSQQNKHSVPKGRLSIFVLLFATLATAPAIANSAALLRKKSQTQEKLPLRMNAGIFSWNRINVKLRRSLRKTSAHGALGRLATSHAHELAPSSRHFRHREFYLLAGRGILVLVICAHTHKATVNQANMCMRTNSGSRIHLNRFLNHHAQYDAARPHSHRLQLNE